jgi:hypothetical protein
MGMAGRPIGGRAPGTAGRGLAAVDDGAAQLAAEMAEMAAVQEVMGRLHAAQHGHVPWRAVSQAALIMRPNEPASRNRKEQERRLLHAQEVEDLQPRNPPRIVPGHADSIAVPDAARPMFGFPNPWDFGQPLPTFFDPGEARDDNAPAGGFPRAFSPPAPQLPNPRPQIYLGRELVGEPALHATSPLPTYRRRDSPQTLRQARPAPHATAAAARNANNGYVQIAVPRPNHRPRYAYFSGSLLFLQSPTSTGWQLSPIVCHRLQVFLHHLVAS